MKTALRHLDGYKSNHTTAIVTGAIGGAMVGFMVGDMWGGDENDEWRDEYTCLLIGSGVMAIISGVCENTAVNHLLEAVRIHNCGVGSEPPPSDDMGALNRSPLDGLAVSYTVRF